MILRYAGDGARERGVQHALLRQLVTKRGVQHALLRQLASQSQCHCSNQAGATSGFNTHKAVTYHEPTVLGLFMIGHSLGRMEMCVFQFLSDPGDPSTWCRAQNTSRIQLLYLSAVYIIESSSCI